MFSYNGKDAPEPIQIHSGVGQGGPLGPTLYKFFKLAVTTAMHKRKDEIWPGGLTFWVAHDSTNRLRHNRTNGGSWTNTESASEIQPTLHLQMTCSCSLTLRRKFAPAPCTDGTDKSLWGCISCL